VWQFMFMAKLTSFTIAPVTYADVNALAKIGADSFANDRHTLVKQLGKRPLNLEESGKESLRLNLKSEKFVYQKAVDDATGEPIGLIGLYFRGVEPNRIPWTSPGEPNLVVESALQPGKNKRECSQHGPADEDDTDVVSRLNALEDADLRRWSELLMPEGTKCIVLVAFSVTPEFQSRGVGSALLKWSTDVADRLDVFMWVHSSEAAWKMYEKHGFETVGKFEVDLDDWAPASPSGAKEQNPIWGHYVCRYMKRFTRSR
jgi:GNAT superfamily N-acetyltransferase